MLRTPFTGDKIFARNDYSKRLNLKFKPFKIILHLGDKYE